jgi:ATP-binding cassette subfamily B (MDR/TAP) protein 1
LLPQYLLTCKGHIKAGFAFGLSQCTIYLIFAAIFYGGSLIIRYSYDPVTNTYGVSSENIFIAMFAIFFGASQAGTSASLGPDVTKAKAAAEKIFKIIERPSKINAVEMENDKSLL